MSTYAGMTPEGHRREAKRLMALVNQCGPDSAGNAMVLMANAKVHAALSQPPYTREPSPNDPRHPSQ